MYFESICFELCAHCVPFWASFSLQDKLNKTISETVKGNLAQGFKQQKAVIEESVLTSLTAARSRAVSPAQSVSDYAAMERRVLNFIQERDYNSAFQQVGFMTLNSLCDLNVLGDLQCHIFCAGPLSIQYCTCPCCL